MKSIITQVQGERTRTHNSWSGGWAGHWLWENFLGKKTTFGWYFTWRDRNNLKKALKKVLTLESLLSSDMLDEESGLSGGEESTCNGPSFSILTSDGVCKGGALNREYWKTIHNLISCGKNKKMSFYCCLIIFYLTGCFVLCSSSCALESSCSKELASSLNKPTSSQFFRKRVGVGVWSA